MASFRSKERRKSFLINNDMATRRSLYLNFCILFKCRRLITNLFFPTLFTTTNKGLQTWGISGTYLIQLVANNSLLYKLRMLKCRGLVFLTKGVGSDLRGNTYPDFIVLKTYLGACNSSHQNLYGYAIYPLQR